MPGVATHADTSRVILARLLRVVEATSAEHEPFSHIYFENLFPEDTYAEMMASLPAADRYRAINVYKHSHNDGVSRATCCRWTPRIWALCRRRNGRYGATWPMPWPRRN